MIMGAVYLSYSAYFLSADFVGIKKFMRVIIVILYLGLGITNVKNLRENLITFRNYIAQNVRDNNLVMIPAMKLKFSILL